MIDDSRICLNDDTSGAIYRNFAFPLERRLRQLSKNPNIFVIGIFDSCRDPFTMQNLRKFKPEQPEQPEQLAINSGETKGLLDGNQKNVDQNQKLVLLFGCAPGNQVNQDENISFKFTSLCWEHIKKK